MLGLTKDTLRQTYRADTALNAAAESAVSRILQHGDSVVKELPRYGAVSRPGADGFGARWRQENGEFIGFINP